MTEDVIKGDVERDGVGKVDVVKGGAVKGDAAKGEAAKGGTAEGGATKGAAARGDAVKGAATKGAAARGDAVKGAATKGAAAKGDAVKVDTVKAGAVKGDLTLPAPREGAADDPGEPLLVVEGLVKHFPVKGGFPIRRTVGAVQAVDGIDLTVNVGESFGLVGESGCGKSTTGRLITRLLEPTSGRITYRGQDISHASRKQLAPVRSEIQMIFQDPYSSLNPRQTVGKIIAGPMEINGIRPSGGREKRVRELLEIVGLSPEHYNRFPHEFSGGQRQRIGVARALALEPKLIVADEPVSALDVSIQAQVVNLLQQVQKDLGIAFLFIAHDLAVVRHFSQRVAVMYLGKVIEVGDRDSIYARPRHPYTHALLSAVPEVDLDGGGETQRERIRLAGDVPSPISPPSGCRFRTRCWKAQDKCAAEEPPLVRISGNRDGHLTACHFPEDPTTGAREEDIVLDPALVALEEGVAENSGEG